MAEPALAGERIRSPVSAVVLRGAANVAPNRENLNAVSYSDAMT